MRKIPSENRIELAVAIYILEVDLDINEVVRGEPGGFNNLSDVFETLTRLLRKLSGDGSIRTLRALA